MSDFAAELARLMTARGVGVRELARMVPCNPGHISNLRNGRARPSPGLAADLDQALDADGTLAVLAPAPGHRQHTVPGIDPASDDELAALDLARRAEASEVGPHTPERLELIVDDLATAYSSTPPVALLGRARAHLSYTGRLLDGRATLGQHRRLLVAGAWLSLLSATCLIDLHRDRAALAHLRTATQLARETGNAEIAVAAQRGTQGSQERLTRRRPFPHGHVPGVLRRYRRFGLSGWRRCGRADDRSAEQARGDDRLGRLHRSVLNLRTLNERTCPAALLALGASLPLVSMDAERAARQIIEAVRARRAEIILTPAGQLVSRVAGLVPG